MKAKKILLVLLLLTACSVCSIVTAQKPEGSYTEYELDELLKFKKIFTVIWECDTHKQTNEIHVKAVFHQYDSKGNHIGQTECDSIKQGFTGTFKGADKTKTIKVQIFVDYFDSNNQKRVGYDCWVNKLYDIKGQKGLVIVEPGKVMSPEEPQKGSYFLELEKQSTTGNRKK